jgi:predicted secreted protein
MSLNLNRNVMSKPVFGSGYARSLGGQRSGTFSANGHVAAEKIAAITALFEADAAVTFSIQVGAAGTATDGGLYTGACQVSSYSVETNADGEWDWSIQATTDGAVIYTPGSSS